MALPASCCRDCSNGWTGAVSILDAGAYWPVEDSCLEGSHFIWHT